MDHRYANEATFTKLKMEKIHMKNVFVIIHLDALRKKIPLKKIFFQKLIETFQKYRLNRTTLIGCQNSIFFPFITTERIGKNCIGFLPIFLNEKY